LFEVQELKRVKDSDNTFDLKPQIDKNFAVRNFTGDINAAL